VNHHTGADELLPTWQGELHVADRIGDDIRDARRTIDRLETEHLTQRLDHLQQLSAGRTLGQDLGISL
jgi:hypothetical protein